MIHGIVKDFPLIDSRNHQNNFLKQHLKSNFKAVAGKYLKTKDIDTQMGREITHTKFPHGDIESISIHLHEEFTEDTPVVIASVSLRNGNDFTETISINDISITDCDRVEYISVTSFLLDQNDLLDTYTVESTWNTPSKTDFKQGAVDYGMPEDILQKTDWTAILKNKSNHLFRRQDINGYTLLNTLLSNLHLHR